MNTRDKGKPGRTAAGRQREEERAARRAASLRANLRKRKQQQRGREDPESPQGQEE